MLDFIILLEILGICALVYGAILLVRFLRGRVSVHVRYSSTDFLSELGNLEKNSSEGGAGFDLCLTSDRTKSIGKLVVKDEKSLVYLPRTEEGYSSDKTSYRKMGYVDAEGYVYVLRKGQEPERIGYLAQPSKPNVPTIIGERTWKDCYFTSRLNAYYGDPEGWESDEIETVVQTDETPDAPLPDHGSAEAPTSQEMMDNTPVPNQSFPAKAPSRKKKEIVEETEEPAVETPVVEEPAAEVPVVEETVAEEPVAEEPVVEEVVVEEVVVEEPVVEESVVEEPAVAETPVSVAPVAPVAPVIPVDEAEQAVGFRYVQDEKETAYLETVKQNYADLLVQIRREMIKVEGGTFIMGVDAEEGSDYDMEKNEGPAHRVTLDSYYIGKYPVTQKYWTAIMGYNNSAQVNEDYPVAPVDWNECMLFVSRLNALTGLKFSLPTEAQWEFAARGGNLSNGYIYAGSNSKGTVAMETHSAPVGKKKPNELGIYDMSGLVREWCSDWYVLRYPSEEQFNPQGPAMPENPLDRKHVVRSPFGNETVTNRKGELPDNPQNFKSYGFRLVCEPSVELGAKVKPVLVGHSCKVGFMSMAPKGCPITDEARGAAYTVFYHKYGKNAYSESLGQSPYGWRDTALMTSAIFSALYLVLYFVYTYVFQMPLLGDFGSIFVMSAFYFILWAVVRMVKIQCIESGHSFQPILDLMNKTLGNRTIDIVIIVLGVLSITWTYLFYDADYIPLIMAVILGVTLNMTNKRNAMEWEVVDPLQTVAAEEFEEEEEQEDRILAPEGDVRKDYNWKLDSFVDKKIKAHIAVSFVQSEVAAQRYKNPFFLEKPNLTVADYKNYVRRMKADVLNNEAYSLHTKYVIQEINRISSKNELNELDSLQFVLDFIQESIAYQLDCECSELARPKEYIRYPDELLYDQQGDCDCKAFFAAVCYYLMGYDVMLLISRQLGHSAVAVSVKDETIAGLLKKDSLDDVTIEINGRKYYYCETTSDGFLIGDSSEGVNVDKFETRIDWIHTGDEE